VRARRCLLLAATALPGVGPPVAATSPPEALLPSLRWEHRLVVYQVDNGETAKAVRRAAADHEEVLAERRILFLPLHPGETDRADPPSLHRSLSGAERDELRERWEIAREGTVFLLVGLDGTVKDRRESLPDWEAWAERIDRMPMRRRELREGEGA